VYIKTEALIYRIYIVRERRMNFRQGSIKSFFSPTNEPEKEKKKEKLLTRRKGEECHHHPLSQHTCFLLSFLPANRAIVVGDISVGSRVQHTHTHLIICSDETCMHIYTHIHMHTFIMTIDISIHQLYSFFFCE